jgi:predicted ATP-grasp superfamily ATP-dependent carboligase
LEIAQKCGIRVPKTAVVSNSEQLPEFVNAIPFPWISKPSAKQQRGGEFKSRVVKTLPEVAKNFPAAREFDPPMLLQEYCRGVGVGVEILLHNGECVAVFQHRRLQELPYGGGVAVTAVAEPPDPSLVHSCLDLLRALRWNGIAMVEFKVNPADGQAVLMEVNGRYWGTISLPVIAGIDFPLYHWKLLAKTCSSVCGTSPALSALPSTTRS